MGNYYVALETEKLLEENREKSSYVSLTMLKALIVWITTKYGKFLRRWTYQTTLPDSWETCMQIKMQQLEPDME